MTVRLEPAFRDSALQYFSIFLWWRAAKALVLEKYPTSRVSLKGRDPMSEMGNSRRESVIGPIPWAFLSYSRRTCAADAVRDLRHRV